MQQQVGYRVLSSGTTSTTQVSQVTPDPVVPETDEEIIERLRERFQILEDMTRAVKAGHVKAMIVAGAPGVGKSFGVNKVLSRYEMLSDLTGNDKLKKYEIVKGMVSPLGLYMKLYEYREKNCILVFDDCDSIFTDEDSLNILKAAMDSSERRVINWNTDSRALARGDIPHSFEFKGGGIFITNVKLDRPKNNKIGDHLRAIESRCHYLDLTIDTEREKMLRIRQIIGDGMLEKYYFDQATINEIIQYIDENKTRLRELSLRMVIKISDLRKSMPDSWTRVAELTCIHKRYQK